MHISQKHGEIALGAAGLTLAGLVILQIGTIQTRSFGDPIGARLMPTVLGIVIALVSSGLIASALRIKDEARSDQKHSTVITLMLACALYVAAMEYLGFYVVTWLLAFLVQALGKGSLQKFVRAGIGATSICVGFYSVFDLGLRVSFPKFSLFGLG